MAAGAAVIDSSAAVSGCGVPQDTSTWPVFSNLRCKPAGRGARTASVYCTFSESQAPAEGNPDSFWTVYLQRQPGGRWLIDNYGQG